PNFGPRRRRTVRQPRKNANQSQFLPTADRIQTPTANFKTKPNFRPSDDSRIASPHRIKMQSKANSSHPATRRRPSKAILKTKPNLRTELGLFLSIAWPCELYELFILHRPRREAISRHSGSRGQHLVSG